MPISIKVNLNNVDRRIAAFATRAKNPLPFFRKAAPILQKDIADHFNKNRGPTGPWKRLTARYATAKRKAGGNPNKILVLSGLLKKQATKAKISRRTGVTISPGVEYAPVHQFGFRFKNIPARPFLWLSADAQKRIRKASRDYYFKGRR